MAVTWTSCGYRFADAPESLQTTQRYFNNEATKLNSPYGRCEYQGIASGWGDD